MEPAAAATPAAGWFADPHIPNTLCWWDGMQWTHHVHPAAPTAPAHHAAAGHRAVPTHHAAAGHQAVPVRRAVAAHDAAAVNQAFPSHNAYSVAASAASPAAVAGHATPAKAESSLMDTNPKSLMAIVVSLLYLAMAITTGIVLAGIVPAMFTFRAFEGREKLAPAALLAAVVTIGFAFTHAQVR